MLFPELLPFTVAVVGHRDLRAEDIPVLEASVEATLQSLQDEAAATPIMLLSALAEGADRLAARVALKLGMRLVVPMPQAHAQYRSTFSSDASRSEFDALLSQADQHFVLSADAAPVVLDEGVQFEHLIAYLAKHSQLLLALWDGEETNLTGGTSHAVQFKLEGVPVRLDPQRSPLDPPDTGPVYHIFTPRESNPSAAMQPGTIECMLPHRPHGATGGDTHARIVRHMDVFNRDTKETLSSLSPAARSRSTPLLPTAVMATLGEPLRHEARAFAEADALAQYFQRKTNIVINVFMGLALVAFFFFEVYAYYFPEFPLIMLLYVVPVVLAYGLFLIAKRRDYQNKYLDYRALAEGLRVQWFWHLGGINASVADLYLRKQRTELDWIRHAIRIWHVRVSSHTGGDVRDRLQLLLKHWVDDQARYYSRAARRDNAKAVVMGAWSNRLFLAGMGIAMAHVALQLLEASPPLKPMLMLMSMVLIIAGLLVIFMDKRGFVSQAKQFARMTELYDTAAPQIREALAKDDVDAARDLIVELGHEALVENGDWVMMHRERPLEVPKLG